MTDERNPLTRRRGTILIAITRRRSSIRERSATSCLCFPHDFPNVIARSYASLQHLRFLRPLLQSRRASLLHPCPSNMPALLRCTRPNGSSRHHMSSKSHHSCIPAIYKNGMDASTSAKTPILLLPWGAQESGLPPRGLISNPTPIPTPPRTPMESRCMPVPVTLCPIQFRRRHCMKSSITQRIA